MSTSTFENLADGFHKHFPSMNDHFKVGNALVLLLRNQDLLPQPEQRLAALFLLWEVNKGETMGNSPFAPVFAHVLLSGNDRNSIVSLISPIGKEEKAFLSQLASTTIPPRDILMQLKKTPRQIVSIDPGPNVGDWGGLKLSLAEKHDELPAEGKSGLSCIITDPETDSRPVIYIKHNSLTEDVPIVVVFKALGLESDQDVVQMVGTEDSLMSQFAPNLEECHRLQIFTQTQVCKVGGQFFVGCHLKEAGCMSITVVRY
ncbi:putative CCR4-NOT transcription complex subunit 11 [Apostichopus japonicus]|uniref:CCR4-NOT transcription complex subunit 11 n=1 Tax=Stichopus japonicus TaxID=307972 RepID=A0A2G8LDZ5_STIJA|nr:putative CCR4-NOT transcription complex subunit 11 [Apostichopus japonicus]